MKSLGKHLGFVTNLEDLRFKEWLNSNAPEILGQLGIQKGQTVLDFGSGSGTYTIAAAKLVGETGVVYALDISRRALEALREKAEKEGLKNIVRIQSSGEVRIPLGDHVVDHLLLIDVLHDLEEKGATFGEVHRVLKSEGTVSVYAMHMKNDEVIELATSKGFQLKQKKFDDHILLFRKQN